MPYDERWPLEGLSQRLPPSNLQAEQSLLGALLANNKAIERCGELRIEHFSDPVNARTFAEIKRRIDEGKIVDAVSLKDFARTNSTTGEEQGMAHLAHLLASYVGIINVTEYADVIRKDCMRRHLIDIGEQLVNGCFYSGDPAILWEEILSSGDAVMLDGISKDSATTLDAAMRAAEDAMAKVRSDGKMPGISTGFRCLDERLGGLEPGFVYVLAGRPGMGKSSLGHQIAVHVAKARIPVMEISLEMSAQQLGRRTLATAARVPIMALKTGRLSNADADRVVQARQELAGLPLTIDDAGGQTASQIATKARSYRRKNGLGLIMVDHLNLMRAEEADARHGGTWAVERASGTMLQLAKDCACPVLLLAQLNRGVEGREDKRPTLADLRQAGAIEQDAYAVGFVYRPEYYLEGEPEKKEGETQGNFDARCQTWKERVAAAKGKAEVIWRKVRDGESASDALSFDGPTATFGEAISG